MFEEIGLKVLEVRRDYPKNINLRRAVINHDTAELHNLEKHINRRLKILEKHVVKDKSMIINVFENTCKFLDGKVSVVSEKTGELMCEIGKETRVVIDKFGKLSVNSKSINIPSTEFNFGIYLVIVQYLGKSTPDAEYVLIEPRTLRFKVATNSGLVSNELVSNLPKQKVRLYRAVLIDHVREYCVLAKSPEEAVIKAFSQGYDCSRLLKAGGEPWIDFNYIVVVAPLLQDVSVSSRTV